MRSCSLFLDAGLVGDGAEGDVAAAAARLGVVGVSECQSKSKELQRYG